MPFRTRVRLERSAGRITSNWDTPAGNRGGTTGFLAPNQVNFGGNITMGGGVVMDGRRWRKR